MARPGNTWTVSAEVLGRGGGIGIVPWLAGCAAPPSALTPAGEASARIAELFSWMLGGGLVIWLLVMGLAVYALYRPAPLHPGLGQRLILGGGVILPTLVLAVLLGYGLALLPVLSAPPPPGDGSTITVIGERWWWRVRYEDGSGETVELANELRLPRGQRVEIQLESADMIHAFWVPALAGKMDMLPGRVTRLVLEPQHSGVFRGVCAEYCGTAHALMAFVVVVMEPPAWADWLAGQRAPAAAPRTAQQRAGAAQFLANGCGACHRIRGSAADGVIGPDLTHLASRHTLAAGTLRNGTDSLRRWLTHTAEVKPGVRMPAFAPLPEADLAALVTYLAALP